MKIYQDYVYTVIELSTETFKKITDHLLPRVNTPYKYLLGNEKETEYLLETLGLEPTELWPTDYYKIIEVK